MKENEKQGQLGNLGEMSVREVKELLRRQNALAENKKFIARLPDKGEKITQLIERLKSELRQREKVDETADLFHKMALKAERARRGPEGEADGGMADGGTADGGSLKDIVHTGSAAKVVVDERGEGDEKYQNSYERVMLRSQGHKPQHRSKFFPNRTKKEHSVREITTELTKNMGKEKRDIISLDQPVIAALPQNVPVQTVCQKTPLEGQGCSSDSDHFQDVASIPGAMDQSETDDCQSDVSVCSHKTLQDAGSEGKPWDSLRYRYDESLEMSTYGPPLRHTSAQLVNLQDSMKLLQEQTRRLEKLHAEQAAERLAGSLGTAFVNPEGSSLYKYRETLDTDSEDNLDDSLDEQDYPD